MDANVRAAYQQMIEDASENRSFRQIYGLVRRAAERNDVELRVDAQWFLSDNILQMIILPVDLARSNDKSLPSTMNLLNMINRDLDKILSAAMEDAREREKREITSSSAIRGVGRVIENLSISEPDIWG